MGAGPASYIFAEYYPGSDFPPPPVPPEPPPTAGGSSDQLRWTIFDTAAGDGVIPGFTSYHMARVLYTPDFNGSVDVAFYEGGGQSASWWYRAFYLAVNPARPRGPQTMCLCTFGNVLSHGLGLLWSPALLI